MKGHTSSLRRHLWFVCVLSSPRQCNVVMWAATVWMELNTNRQANSHTHASARCCRANVSDYSPAAAGLFIAFPHVPLSKTLNHLPAQSVAVVRVLSGKQFRSSLENISESLSSWQVLTDISATSSLCCKWRCCWKFIVNNSSSVHRRWGQHTKCFHYGKRKERSSGLKQHNQNSFQMTGNLTCSW